MNREQMFYIERLRREALVNGNIDEYEKFCNELYEKSRGVVHLAFPISDAFDYVKRTKISRDVIKKVSEANGLILRKDIDQIRAKCFSFVENELDVDINEVSIVRVCDSYKTHEAMAVSCGENQHIVVFPPKGLEFESADLLVHELAHAAEWTIRRKLNDDTLLVSHKLFSETIAHYCQYRYLLEHGTAEERIGAIGSITKDYLTLRAVLASIELRQNNLGFLNIEDILEHRFISDFTEVYGMGKIKEILSPFNGRPLSQLYHLYAEPRIGSIVALKLIDNRDAIKKICVAKADRPIKTIMQDIGLDVENVMDFTVADSLIKKFMAGTL